VAEGSLTVSQLTKSSRSLYLVFVMHLSIAVFSSSESVGELDIVGLEVGGRLESTDRRAPAV